MNPNLKKKLMNPNLKKKLLNPNLKKKLMMLNNPLNHRIKIFLLFKVNLLKRKKNS